MKRCTAAVRHAELSVGRLQPRRWASYDKSTLTKEALTQKIEAGLGDDEYAKSLRLDPDAKTISTASGSLPISPLFDPDWIKARRRQTKSSPAPPTGRFRRKLANNPFARALATPIRQCIITNTTLPRYFFQDFEIVQHPETGKQWLAPGSLSFNLVNPSYNGEITQASEVIETEEKEPASADTKGEQRPRAGRALRGYALSRKWLISAIATRKRLAGTIFAPRSGMAVTPSRVQAVVRDDMADALLSMLRRTAVDALIRRSNRQENTRHMFMEPCASWEAVKDVNLRGCVLWLPQRREDAMTTMTQYATLDVDGVSYGRKMALHNLDWLLGEEEMARLRAGSDMFRDNEIVVLKQWPRPSMMQLHLLLWRLQGYLTPARSKAWQS